MHNPIDVNGEGSTVVSGEGPMAQPFCRRERENHVLVFPDKLVCRTCDVNEHFLVRPKIRVESAHIWLGSLHIEIAADDERGSLNLLGRRRIPTPSGALNW